MASDLCRATGVPSTYAKTEAGAQELSNELRRRMSDRVGPPTFAFPRVKLASPCHPFRAKLDSSVRINHEHPQHVTFLPHSKKL